MTDTDTDAQKLADRIARAVRLERGSFPSASLETINALLDAAARITELEAQVSASDARVAEATKQPYDYRTENGTPKSPKQSKKAKWQ